MFYKINELYFSKTSRSWREENNEELSQMKEHYRSIMESTSEHGARMKMSLFLGNKHEIFSGKEASHFIQIKGKNV